MSENKMPKGRANDIDKLVSKKLKMRRIFLGLSQQELALVAKVTVQQMQKYEKAVNRISSGKLYILAKFLNVPVNYFFNESNANTNKTVEKFIEPEDSNAKEDSEQVFEREVTNLIKYYITISDAKVRRKFFELIKSVSGDK